MLAGALPRVPGTSFNWPRQRGRERVDVRSMARVARVLVPGFPYHVTQRAAGARPAVSCAGWPAAKVFADKESLVVMMEALPDIRLPPKRRGPKAGGQGS